MKRIIKILITGLIGIIVVLAIFVFTLVFTGKIEIGFDKNGKFEVVINNDTGEMDTYDQIIEASKTTYPTDIFVYGDDCKFRKNAKYIKIDKLTEETIKSDKKYKVIVLNDVYGALELTDADFTMLYKNVIEGEYALLYLGTKYTQTFVEKEFVINDFAEGAIGFGLRHSRETVIQSSGLWDEMSLELYENEDDEVLGEAIFMFIRKVIREG